jgi:hypothetical protein
MLETLLLTMTATGSSNLCARGVVAMLADVVMLVRPGCWFCGWSQLTGGASGDEL